ncbi:tryptophan--tRNA ligase [Dasania marina]|uniref:tryptophan--tRNA ligase n=1 Tax=Dasania marina TaxID=471499 RepID=UPI0030D97187|tara:strand:- start:30074 stop:31084 length:1011 start_codon:yes stop_codon:yes gene_type:complete
MAKQRVLTGITTTGTPHLGNYVGAIRPAIESSRSSDIDAYFFLADYHALIKCGDPAKVQQSTKEIAATWLALGLDTDNTTFYRQSDVPEVTELSWILTCLTAKGLMNRAHAYKASVQVNEEEGVDPDKGIMMGLFNYPILMAADILMFNGEKIPVGKDQVQHIEMARDIAQKFNHHYKQEVFTLPEAVVGEDGAILSGLDGRKMSKSYNNTIPLFLPEKKLQKHINKIKTNLLEPGEAKDPNDSAVFAIWQAFANTEQQQYMREQFTQGIAWGQAKKELFALINEQVSAARERYEALMADGAFIEQELQKGAAKARASAKPLMEKVRRAAGIAPIS